MNKSMMAILVASGLMLSAPVMAQPAQPSLYQQLGGKDNIRSLMDDFVQRLKADSRIGEQFKNTDAARLASQLTDQVCEATGGPCKYVGLDMKAAHAGMNITKAHFNALVEVLQASMNAKGVPFDKQLEILSMLAPMHRDVITVR
ncbi:MAG: group I truncated hemoglobin [Limnobacter sp.]|uniref:group I truncated hemoglobin n=1 Tax=Limnobacter sp. TaxID=2003368 RepID=UPI00391DFEA2